MFVELCLSPNCAQNPCWIYCCVWSEHAVQSYEKSFHIIPTLTCSSHVDHTADEPNISSCCINPLIIWYNSNSSPAAIELHATESIERWRKKRYFTHAHTFHPNMHQASFWWLFSFSQRFYSSVYSILNVAMWSDVWLQIDSFLFLICLHNTFTIYPNFTWDTFHINTSAFHFYFCRTLMRRIWFVFSSSLYQKSQIKCWASYRARNQTQHTALSMKSLVHSQSFAENIYV